MIDRKDVVTIRIPFPDISSDLAFRPHMYICHWARHKVKRFVKCQSLKPYMLTYKTINHFVDEKPDPNRNPFTRLTRIDCDKEFYTTNLRYPLSLRTTTRPDVCDELIQIVDTKLICDSCDSHALDEQEMTKLNNSVYRI